MKPSWQIEDEVLEWHQMTPAERWRESQKLWAFYLSVGGSLDPEPDSESPFDTSVMRGVDPFEQLWERRTTVTGSEGESFDVLSLPDLVKAKIQNTKH